MSGVHELPEVVRKYRSEYQRDAYHVGVELGHGFIVENGAVDEDNAVGVAFECYESYQQFSPWEFTAAEWNRHETRYRCEGKVWGAFEDGLAWGARYAYWKAVCGL